MRVVENIINSINQSRKQYFTKEEIIRLINITTEIKRLPSITLGGITLNPEKYNMKVGDNEIHLKKREFELMYMLMGKPNITFTREKIIKHVWGDDVVVLDRTIDVHICKINKKIGKSFVTTFKGIGYKCSL